MSCPSCKGTGQVVLLYSSVPCVDCIPGKTFTVDLPAAPMAKCEPGNVVLLWDGYEGGRDEMPARRCDRVLFDRTPEPGHVYEWSNSMDLWIYKDTI